MTRTRTATGQFAREAMRSDPVTRFWAKVDKTDSCWNWIAAIGTSGYGVFTPNGGCAQRLAHRYAYELHSGPIADGLQVDHLCRNRRCVNPVHLEAVTPRVNTLRSDGVTAQNARKTHCPAGHPYDDANTCRKGRRRACRACARESSRRRRAS